MARSEKRRRQKENTRAARAARQAAQKRSRRTKAVVRLAIAAALVAAIALLVSVLGRNDDETAADSTSTTAPADTTTTTVALPAGCTSNVPDVNPDRPTSFDAAPEMTIDPSKTYTATLSTTCGDFTITLDDDNAPETVNSFVFLARQGFYDGLTFHRVAKDFVIQGGDPAGDGSGGPGYTLPDEPPPGGYAKGSVAMANSGSGTTGSQFFVVLTDEGASGLGGPPYLYSSLGTVTDGADVVERLGSLYNADQSPSDPSTQRSSVPLYIFKVEITES